MPRDPHWRQNNEIQACSDYAKNFDRPVVIVLSFDSDGRYHLVSYGKNARLCDLGGKYVEWINGLLQDPSAQGVEIFDNPHQGA